ncbi:MAG: RNA methyltransferase PUA domain-containing protein, partial [Microthrixaceae bacterium]
MDDPTVATPGATGASPWMEASTQVLVDDVLDPQLDDEALHHLSRVLRLRDGETVCASDGAGGWALCGFNGTRSLTVTRRVGREPAPEPALSVGVA